VLRVTGLVLLPIASLGQVWDVGDTSRSGQWTFHNRTANGSEIGLPVAAGDLNGDGLDDVVLTPMNADSGPERDRRHAGEVAIVLSSGSLRGVRDLARVDPTDLPGDVTLVYGADERDFLGTEVWAADVDGDGFDDVLVGAQYGDGPDNARAECGEVAIVWGGVEIGGKVIDLRAPSPDSAVTFVYGAEAGDRLGIWVGAGDFDADGVDDLAVGADQGDGPDGLRTHAGETYVVYGGAALRGRRSIDLASPELPSTVVYGIDREDHSGATVRATDLDRDGAAELLIGAGLNRLSASIGSGSGFGGHGSGGGDGRDNRCDPVGFTCNTGEAYVVYGQVGARPDVIDLRMPPASTVFIYGIDAHDAYGEELFGGDFNGDGIGDVVVGALTADGPDNTRGDAGEIALVFGGIDLRGATIDLADSPANVVFFFGEFGGSIAGDTAMLTDVDGDGKDDVVLSSPTAPVGPLEKAGTVHVFFGSDEPLPQRIDLREIPAGLSVLRIDGGAANDILSYSSAPGDFDGDGRMDPLLNIMGGDGFDDLLPQAGDAVVLSGAALGRTAGRLELRCAGDCDRDQVVSSSELVLGVRIALGQSAMTACPALDADEDDHASIAELVRAVDNALAEGARCEE
jgi:hypothetical protein